VLETPRTAIECIYSLEICRMPGPKVYLTVFGNKPKYSKKRSDIVELDQTYFKNATKEFKVFIDSKTINTPPFETSKKDNPFQGSEKQVDLIPNLKNRITVLEKIVQTLTTELNNETNEINSINRIMVDFSDENFKLKEKINEWENQLKKNKLKMMNRHFLEEIRRDLCKEFKRRVYNENIKRKKEKLNDIANKMENKHLMEDSKIEEINTCTQCQEHIRKNKNLKATNLDHLKDNKKLETKLDKIKTLVKEE
jgi:hypothetical protein